MRGGKAPKLGPSQALARRGTCGGRRGRGLREQIASTPPVDRQPGAMAMREQEGRGGLKLELPDSVRVCVDFVSNFDSFHFPGSVFRAFELLSMLGLIWPLPATAYTWQ